MLGKRSSIRVKSADKRMESNSHAVQHSSNRRKQVAKPTDHGGRPKMSKMTT